MKLGKLLKKGLTFALVAGMLASSIGTSNVSPVKAKELGKGTTTDFLTHVSERIDLKKFPKIWTGNYDGSGSNQSVNRKYALVIDEIDIETGDFKGRGYVDKGDEKPSLQVRAIYNCEGTIDVSKASINWQGKSFIEDPGDFNFLKFTANYAPDLKEINGTTNAQPKPKNKKQAEVHLTNAKSMESWATNGFDSFDYEDTELNYDLLSECMQLSLLIYGQSAYNGNGLYVKAKGTTQAKSALKDKLKSEGFDIAHNYKAHVSSKKENDKIDCIHWSLADRELSDGTKLVYVIVKGTDGDEWYGNFNVASSEDEAIYKAENEGIHWSFQTSAEAVLAKIHEKYSENEKVKYVVTGHSRGAAVANIVAKELTDKKEVNANIEGVYGYTFATPATIAKNQLEKEYDNIFNFCFDDDFVTYLPLAQWGYGRYGKTYSVLATELYKKYELFRMAAKGHFYGNENDVFGMTYKSEDAKKIEQKMYRCCKNVEEFYNANQPLEPFSEELSTVIPTDNIEVSEYTTWYKFFHNTFAPLLSGKLDKADFNNLKNMDMLDIVGKFVVGALGYVIADKGLKHALSNVIIRPNVGLTHDPGSYYALSQLLKYREDSVSELVEMDESKYRQYGATKSQKKSAKVAQLEVDALDGANVSVLREFAENNENNKSLSWDLEDPSTWTGITWNEAGMVTAIDLESLGLEGKLNLSQFTALEYLECSSNRLTDLVLPDVDKLDVYCDGNYLSMNPKKDLYKKLMALAEKGNIVSCENQSVPENAKFASAEVTKLKAFANEGDNLVKLGWDLDKPDSYRGIKWILIDGSYFVEKIDLSQMGLTGTADFSKFNNVTSVELAENELEGVNLSGCSALESINVCQNKIKELDISNSSKIQRLFCSNNYLVENMSTAILSLYSDDNDAEVELYPQYCEASEEAFDVDELETLKDFVGDAVEEIDWEHPGMNERLQWSMENGVYHLKKLDLSNTAVEGNVDLKSFSYLESINFENTDLEGITTPSATTNFGDYAFANCPNLKDVIVTDSWTSMGTDVFYQSPNVEITCTRNTFAKFIAEALEIPFNEVVRVAYLEVDKEPTTPFLQGEEFSLNGGELKVYYSDTTTKNITEGYTVEGYDPMKLGEQTVTLSYSEENYTKSTTMKVTVYGHTEDGLLYLEKGDDAYAIAGYIGEEKNVTIPEEIEGKKVICINGRAFYQSEVVEVNIPDSVDTMGTYVFQDCKNLEKVHLPNIRVNLMEGTFYNCSALREVNMPDSLKVIQKTAFANCESLMEIQVPDGLEEIQDSAFSRCTSLKEFVMPNSIKNLGDYIFEGCKGLEKVVLNDTRVNIPAGTFFNCESLKEVELPETVENIRMYAFTNCKSLEKIDLHEGIKEIDQYAFSGCASLEKVVFPDSITSIGEYALADCTSLKEVKLNEGRINISRGLFCGCESLVKVEIPDTVTTIRYQAFKDCKALEEINLPASLEEIDSNAFENAPLTKITYAGTVEGWNTILIDEYGNDVIFENTVSTLADGQEIQPVKKKEEPEVTPTAAPEGSNPTSGGNPAPEATKKPSSKPSGGSITPYQPSYHYSSSSGSKTTKPRKVKLLWAKAGKKKCTVIWSWQSDQKGFEVQYARNKSFTKGKKTKKCSFYAEKATIKKLKSKKTYYFRVRAFEKGSYGSKVYGKWSSVKKCKVK